MHSWAMMATMRLIHILAGAFLTGTAIFMAGFLVPTLRSIGPAGGPVMQHLGNVRKLHLYLMTATVLTILTGVGLYSIDSAGFRTDWMRSGPGATFGIGGLLALIAAGIGMGVNAPTGKKMADLSAAIGAKGGLPSVDQTAEIQRLQGRLAAGSRGVAIFLAFAVCAMAVARYVP
ncbi:MAG: hypothetical protein M3081_13845 [Gemmatimonadota bacterium]|nr:hypothetical protein [Gemmatimonadota bacterium]